MLNGEKLFEKKYSKILLFLLVDVLALVVSSILALAFRFDFEIPLEFYNNIVTYMWIDLLILIFIFALFKLYTSVWKYASITELLGVGMACILFEATTYLYKMLFSITMPRSYYILQCILLIFLVGGFRFSYRILRAILNYFSNGKRTINTMIVGAGDACRLLINEINNDKKGFDNKVLCIIDDNVQKKGSYINQIPIVGTRETISENCEKYNINEIIIAIPSANKNIISEIVDECQKTKCTIKILPQISRVMRGNLLGKVRPISYEDFLGRDEIVVDIKEIQNTIKDKVILVTGGGGSIGSELCRQIAKANPKTLIIFDIYENNAYEIQQELYRNYPNLNLETIIGSVRDYDRLEKVFMEFKPDTVFHAAAHKHVPLMEVSPNEAIKNNCFGTLNTAKLANKYKTKKFVLISTDKAVRPTNVMGASKRICEMIIQTYDKLSKNTDYVAVRFGNVLGSNGSVIPLFLKQIENGGPVTVTHKEITRYFMTIPEAVSLILQASVYALGGEIFVLDMGEPVKIYDLAERIIR